MVDDVTTRTMFVQGCGPLSSHLTSTLAGGPHVDTSREVNDRSPLRLVLAGSTRMAAKALLVGPYCPRDCSTLFVQGCGPLSCQSHDDLGRLMSYVIILAISDVRSKTLQWANKMFAGRLTKFLKRLSVSVG